MITIDEIKRIVQDVIKDYPIKRVSLFGSRAKGNNRPDSDVDLLCEFYEPYVSLLTISGLKIDLQERLNLNVDVIHAPLPKDSILEIDKEIELYAA